MEVINALGRRKSAIARIYVKEGKGQITINNRELDNYFAEDRLRFIVKQPLALLEKEASFDIKVNLCGGGIKGQAEAARLAIARALVKMDEENKSPLKKQGFLTRDPREVERKKPGQKKARKRFQFSKR
ncbi:MAG: 30S ribosomal protein S9 [Bacteroidales bacterium]|nr:30S ribosomal protein S9 [Bacteroidales bacterium]